MQELADVCLDLLSFDPWTRESKEEVVRVPHIAQPAILWIVK